MSGDRYCEVCGSDAHEDEAHGEAVVVREGASTRTADELLSVFIDDAVALGAAISPYGRDVVTRVDAALEANRSMGVAWLPEGADRLRDELVSVADQIEHELATAGFVTVWEDGFVIVPAVDDEDGADR